MTLARRFLTLFVPAALLGSGLIGLERRSVWQGEFEADARIVHRVLSQRAAQQETILEALVALSKEKAEEALLGRYAERVLAPHAQVFAAQWCEATCRNVMPDPEPLPPVANVRPAQPTLLWPPAPDSRYALAEGDVRVWVDASRLLSANGIPEEPLHVRILRPDDRGILLDENPLTEDAGLRLSLSKVLGSDLQPFPVRLERLIPVSRFPWAAWGTWWLLSALAAALAAHLWQQQHVAAQALADERRRARGAIQGSSDAVVMLDEAGQVVQHNPAAERLLGVLPAGSNLADLVPLHATLEQAPFDAAFWTAPLDTERPLPDGVALTRGGETRLLEGSLAPLHSVTGRPLGSVLTLREVGALRQRMLAKLSENEERLRDHEALLARASRLSTLSAMGAGLAHELRQPLNALVTFSAAGKRLLAQGETARAAEQFDAVTAQGRRASDVTERLRNAVRQSPPQRVNVDLVQAASTVLSLCAARIERGGVQVQTDFPPQPALVRADPVQTEQILLNLLTNALDAVASVPDPLPLRGRALQSNGTWKAAEQRGVLAPRPHLHPLGTDRHRQRRGPVSGDARRPLSPLSHHQA
ncbi:PAS domain-containing protein [Deinococcus lacus]|uniref:PAS domain-containing protein n=1 Tax=Deinococcus lacus TaxID=392561 RepID=A0ABW1YHM3_9DEIO